MHYLGKKDALLVLAHYALLVWMAQAARLLVGGVVKAIALAGFALLLLFAVGRSADLLKTVPICFHALPSHLFVFSINTRWVRRSQAALILPHEPLRASLFQRPPPEYSL